jgi:hypothetical protein
LIYFHVGDGIWNEASVGWRDSLKLRHLATARELVSIPRPDAGALLEFSPDGRWLAVTAEDNSLRMLAPRFDQLREPK